MVDDVVTLAWETGRATWPTVHVEREQFANHVRDLDPSKFPADLYLAVGCLANDPEALATFEREIITQARGAVRSIDPNDAFVDEACQRVRAALFVGSDGSRPRIADYAGRGPLQAWVGVAAVRTALTMRRSQRRAREVPDDDWSDALAMISTGNPELELLKRQYAAAFSDALRAAVGALEPRLRSAMGMSFVDGLSIDEIGAVYTVHRATAARWIQRACDAVLESTRATLAERLALSQTELDRLTAMVQSQLDVSLSQLLPADVD